MKLSREKILRMVGDQPSQSASSGGGGGGTGVSMAWVDENYISKDFFRQLFAVHGTQTEGSTITEIEVVPNVLAGDGITISNVEVKFDFWSRGGVSALGLGGQGGGGGATSLNELDDVTITSPVNGEALVYRNGMWVNAAVTPDLSDYATKTWVQQQGYLTSLPAHNHDGRYYISGDTIHLGNQSITPLTSSALNDYVPKSTKWWGQSLNNGVVKGVLNSVTSIEFTEPTTGTGGYLHFHFNGDSGDFTSRIIEDASGRIAVNNTAFFHKNATPGSDLKVAMTDWPSVNFQTQITNNVAFHQNIYVRGNVHLRNNGGIDILDNGGTERNVLTFNTYNDLAIGYGTRLAGYSTYIQGSPIHFTVGTSASGIVAATIDNNGQLYIRQATQGIRIGDGLITWDSTNNAIKVSKWDHTSANFVALGGVSALGIGGAGGTDSANIGQLTSDDIYVTGSVNDQDDLWYINTDGFHHDGNIDCNHMTAARFYLDNSRYIFLQNGILKYYDGSTARTITLS